jgi:diguanylate cyclase (GGDEF)-like protein
MSPRARAARGLSLTAVLVLVVYVGFALTVGRGRVGAGSTHLVFSNTVLALAAATLVVRPWSSTADRAVWRPITAAYLLLLAGEVTWALLGIPAGVTIADAAIVGHYGFLLVGLVRMVRSAGVGRSLGSWLDGLVAGLGLVAALGAFWFRDQLADVSTNLEVLIALGYPAADVAVLVVVVVGLAPVGWRPDRTLGLVLAASLCAVAGDLGYVFGLGDVADGMSGWIGVAWSAGAVLMALASQVPRPSPLLTTGRMPNWWVVPALAASAALATLVAGALGAIPIVAVVFAAATFVVAGARVAVAVGELAALADTRAEARTDGLTGLANRRAFDETVAALLAAGGGASVLLADLNRFKEINDSLGHHAGDEVLREVATRLAAAVGRRATVARLGGDEFAVLLAEADPHAAALLAAEVARQLLPAMEVAGVVVDVGVSIGVATTLTATDAQELLRQADIAMYRAKRNRGGVEIYDRRHSPDADRLERAAAVRNDLRAEVNFEVLYQPKYSVADGRIVGAEALVRWHRDGGEALPPGQFLPLLEEANLIPALTRLVASRTVAQMAAWRDEGLLLPVAINISALDLVDTRLAAYLCHVLDRSRVPRGALTVEVVEEAFDTDGPQALRTVAQMRQAGMRVAIDDFGTGFSSLGRLHELQIDELKLDRSFCVDLVADRRKQLIVASVIHLARHLGLDLVTEGIEDEATLAVLRSMHCPKAQGFHLARPMPASALRQRLLHQAQPDRASWPAPAAAQATSG